jgi:hypothetical protein
MRFARWASKSREERAEEAAAAARVRAHLAASNRLVQVRGG